MKNILSVRRLLFGVVVSSISLLSFSVSAHSPVCNCYNDEEGENQIICEGGFSDGASAEGVAIRVLDDRERVLINGVMSEDSTFTFARPDADFHVVYDAGDSHQVTVYMDEIE
ncbi:MAG: hypothetical protein COA96_00685 [SAR86 cluster bacterium]|uniref:Uncharacterized protein n=1 Tax=SAR86 cluster bacterium TaxID=2030880 RepID=A0A2A5BBL3_9GAMM|nr:MAG: hypothetical protein COA96_00685 [SAR86 cluster bacterium]